MIRNLTDELYATVAAEGDEKDHRFTAWCKYVDAVDKAKTNGYCLVGDFIRDGTVEIASKPRLFLVMTASGSMKYHVATYRIVQMDADGTLEATGICTTDKIHGWALRLRDAVADLLTELAAPVIPETQTESVTIDTLTLTTNHSASNYGAPVLLIDGEVYGPADMTPVGITGAELVQAFVARFVVQVA